jgi:hypothetical protein
MDELTLSIEGVIEGNAFREIFVGPVMVLLWACTVFLIDKWVMKVAEPKEIKTDQLMSRRSRLQCFGSSGCGPLFQPAKSRPNCLESHTEDAR